MHPLLTPINRLGLYLLAWTPLTAILIYLMAAPGGLGWWDATFLVVPLCLIYEFVCLSAWYSCKAAPIQTTPVKRLFLTHMVAAAIVSLLWMQAARLIAYLLSQLHSFQGLDQKFAPHAPLLFGPGFVLYVLAVASHYVVLEMDESRAAQARVLETSILARDAELKALKAQINPHFLFNSLNSISALTSIDAARAREMCILLADFLRMTLGLGEKALVPLREELELLQRFLAIEKVRFGERLHVDAHVEAQAQTCLLPPLLLQPLVENAILHGIATLPAGGTVRLSAECSGGQLHLSIENSVDSDALPPRKSGRGLANVRQRLEARYGKEARLQATAEEELFRVTISLPAEMSEAPVQSAEGALAPAKEVRL
ncbi:MAG TPA: histidine kinase [Candidatus Acidoferrum sp.]|nr:histidine kinase [Candidatus Acidoferrum sp.]